MSVDRTRQRSANAFEPREDPVTLCTPTSQNAFLELLQWYHTRVGDRKYKATLSPRRCHRPPPPAAAAGAQRWRLAQHAAAPCHSGLQQGVARLSAVWTGRSGWGRVERQGVTGAAGSGPPVRKS